MPTWSSRRGHRVELDGDPISESAGLAAEDPTGGVPGALQRAARPAVRERDADTLAALERRRADRGESAERDVAQRQRQVRLTQRGQRVVEAFALHLDVQLLPREQPALGAALARGRRGGERRERNHVAVGCVEQGNHRHAPLAWGHRTYPLRALWSLPRLNMARDNV